VIGKFGDSPSLSLFGDKFTLGEVCIAFFFMLSGFFIHKSASSKKRGFFEGPDTTDNPGKLRVTRDNKFRHRTFVILFPI
jgi:hypothetical protein